MLVTFTNASSSSVYLSAIYHELAAGASVQVHRSVAELDSNQSLKAYVAAGTITLAFVLEAGDSVAAGFGPVMTSYTNATRPAVSAVPVFTAIWNTSDKAVNWSDGTNWRDNAGNIT
jgi:hypothetical protein